MSATEQTTDAANDREKLHELLESFDTVMLITQALPEHGENAATKDDFELTSRPMEVARLDDNCDLWFVTDAESAKVYEITSKPVVHVVAQDKRDRFVSVRGTARVLQDKATIRELWSESHKLWFPDGPESPNIRAIHVASQEGQYWDNAGTNKVKYILQAAKAYVSGERMKTGTGDQMGRVEL